MYLQPLAAAVSPISPAPETYISPLPGHSLLCPGLHLPVAPSCTEAPGRLELHCQRISSRTWLSYHEDLETWLNLCVAARATPRTSLYIYDWRGNKYGPHGPTCQHNQTTIQHYPKNVRSLVSQIVELYPKNMVR
jgi:hypothetical protein